MAIVIDETAVIVMAIVLKEIEIDATETVTETAVTTIVIVIEETEAIEAIVTEETVMAIETEATVDGTTTANVQSVIGIKSRSGRINSPTRPYIVQYTKIKQISWNVQKVCCSILCGFG